MIEHMASAEAAAEISMEARLGLLYSPVGSLFRLWAPTALSVSLLLYDTDGTETNEQENTDAGRVFPMQRRQGGVWQLRFAGDLHGKYYMYRAAFADGSEREAADPYARAVSANGVRTAVVDLRTTDPEGWEQDNGPALAHPADAVIYELHVRDFSAHPSSGLQYKGKYKAFTETGVTGPDGCAHGIDHLAELGVTHVHLMPVADFQTVDELGVDGTASYNWGYDPQHYNVPEGSYSMNPADPALRIREFKEMVQALHRKGLSVVMDVVYNHTYSVEKGPFEPLVPGYFYRSYPGGALSNGSGVGNELATERPMVRKYIKDSLRYWAKEYHIDGFRFDLMGLIDTVTMRELVEELRLEVNPNLLFYGEPWTGGDSPLAQKTLKGTQRGKGYAVFNDNFRSAVKGDSDGWGRGFATGEPGREGAVAAGIMGSVHDFAESPAETVNYVTAHDNLNLWDKVLVTQGLREEAGFAEFRDGVPTDGRTAGEAVLNSRPYLTVDTADPLAGETVRRTLLANGLVLTSQGIPFLHAGDELLRSKYGDHNSYRSGDAVNSIRWENKTLYRPVYDYYRGLIHLRKTHPAFRLRGREQIERSLNFLRCDSGVIAYRLHRHAGGDPWRTILVVFNANPHPVTFTLPEPGESWNVVVDHTRAGTETFRTEQGEVKVEGLSMMVLYDVQEDPGPPNRVVEVHYERRDGRYQGWNLWVWGTGVQDGQADFRYIEDGRAVARIEVSPGSDSIGYVLRLNDWEAKDRSGDRVVELDGTGQTVKVLIRDVLSDGASVQAEHLPLTS